MPGGSENVYGQSLVNVASGDFPFWLADTSVRDAGP